jgi:hypothetical protein
VGIAHARRRAMDARTGVGRRRGRRGRSALAPTRLARRRREQAAQIRASLPRSQSIPNSRSAQRKAEPGDVLPLETAQVLEGRQPGST